MLVKPPGLTTRLSSESQDWLFPNSPEISEMSNDLNMQLLTDYLRNNAYM